MDKTYSYLGIGFAAAWFATSFLALIFAALLSIYLNTDRVVKYTKADFRLYAALPSSSLEVAQYIEKKDARAKIVEDFFSKYKSPLASFGDYFIKVADQQGLDFRILPAISMQESNGGKKVIKNSHNPFGYGIYGSLVVKFASWEDAIERVGKALKEDYLDKGLKTPYQIMTKYTPPSSEKDGAWARGVSSFMEELR